MDQDSAADQTVPGLGSLGEALEQSERVAVQRARAALLGGPSEVFVGRYRLIEMVGAGAMGQIWRSRDERLARDVAIKLIKSEHHTAVHVERLAHEARSLARLSHPNVVEVFDIGTYDDPRFGRSVFLAMAFVEGQTLRQWARAPERTWRERLGALVAAGHGLAAAHRIGLVHRDFKPDNVLVDVQERVGRVGRVRVADFGLARLAHGATPHRPRPGVGTNGELAMTLGASLTDSGTVVGTPIYMAPEQLLGGEAGVSTDLYAWCASAYEVLCGTLPFAGDLRAVTAAKREARLVAPLAKNLPPAVVLAAIRRGLLADPQARWPSMQALLEVMERAGRTPPRRWLWRLVGTAAAGVVVVAATHSPEPTDCVPATWDRTAWESRRGAAGAGVSAVTDATIASGVLATLDARAAELDAGVERTCSRTAAARQADQACWQQAARSLDAATSVLASAELSPRAIWELQATLSTPAACTDGTNPMVAPPELSSRVAVLAGMLAAAKIDRAAGRFVQAMAAIDEVTTAVHSGEVPWPPIEGQALFERGRTHWVGGADALGRLDLERAHFAASAAGDHQTAFAAAVELTHFAIGRKDAELAARWLRHADVAATRTAIGAEWMATRMCAVAALALLTDDLARAAEAIAEADALCSTAQCGTAVGRIALASMNLECLRRSTRCVELIMAHEQAEIEKFGSESAFAVTAGVETVQALAYFGRTAEAVAHADSVAERLGRWVGEGTALHARLLSFQSGALSVEGRCDEAVVAARRALELQRREDPQRDLFFFERAVINTTLCSGDAVRALALAHDTLLACERCDATAIADVMFLQTSALLHIGRPTQALTRMQEMRTVYTRASVTSVVELASYSALEASILRELGREHDAAFHDHLARQLLTTECAGRSIVVDEHRASCGSG